MEQKDRLAYEVAMASLQDAKEDYLRWLEDSEPEEVSRRSPRWWSRFDLRPTSSKRLRAS
jgi:hypothetical protein